MRPISQELQAKLNEPWQTPAGRNNPQLKVIAGKQAGELFTLETIHNLENGSDIDVTLKRSDTSTKPGEAYIIYISEGIARTAKKVIPNDPQINWVELFAIGAASSVAIEFDGYWERDINTLKFNFITLGDPWLFWVSDGSLYGQKWTDTTSKIVLATGTVKVAALRGWIPVTAEYFHDQGLIAGYIKNDGHVYYRSYCLQGNGTYIWEEERLVPNLPASVTSLSMFRTNDFRVGFVVETQGKIYWTLSKRNYAGMSFPPDAMTIKNAGFYITTRPIRYLEHDKNISTLNLVDASWECHCGPQTDILSVISTGFLDPYTLFIEFNTEITNAENWQGHFNMASRTVTRVTVEPQTKRLIVTVAEAINVFATAVLSYDGTAGFRISYRLGNTPLLSAFSQTIAASIINHQHQLELNDARLSITSQPVIYWTVFSKDNDHVLTIANAAFAVTSLKVGSSPI